MLNDLSICFFFFFNDTATTEIYTLSLHDALPILGLVEIGAVEGTREGALRGDSVAAAFNVAEGINPASTLIPVTRIEGITTTRSEEHTSELQSRLHLVCRLLLEKKKPVSISRTPTDPCR